MNQLELDFAVAAFSDYDKDGHLRIQTDSPGVDPTKGTVASEALCPLGFYARPLDPEKDDAATVGLGSTLLTARAGNDRYQIPFSDPRDAKLVPKLKKGGRMMAGGAGKYRSFISIDGLDPDGENEPGSIQALASYESDGTKKSHGLSMNVRKKGKEDITIIHGEGQRITLGASGARPITLMNRNGNAWIMTDDKGNTLVGPTKVQGSLQVGSTKAAQPVAIGKAVIAALEALAKAIVAVGAAASAAPGAQGAGPAAIAGTQALNTLYKAIEAQHLSST